MIYTLAGIIVICAFLCLAELIVRIWEKAEAMRVKKERMMQHEVYRRTRA